MSRFPRFNDHRLSSQVTFLQASLLTALLSAAQIYQTPVAFPRSLGLHAHPVSPGLLLLTLTLSVAWPGSGLRWVARTLLSPALAFLCWPTLEQLLTCFTQTDGPGMGLVLVIHCVVTTCFQRQAFHDAVTGMKERAARSVPPQEAASTLAA